MTVRHNLPVAYEDLPGNRSSVVVTVGDGWRAYQPFSILGWDFLGVIQYHGVIGALGQSWTSGSYALHSDDRVRMLDSAEVEQALLQADVWRSGRTAI